DLDRVVWHLRIPRTLLALAAGGALAVSGALAQAWTRNPLADPGIIGITSGAGFAVAAGTTAGFFAPGQQALLALAGSAAVAVVVLAVSRRSADPLTLLRSEERRVGKECRARWRPERYNKKKNMRT